MVYKDDHITPKPMLAGMYVPQAAKFPIDAQPRLDGLRCLVRADDLVLRTAAPGRHTVCDIAEQLARILPAGAIADGEIYIHGIPLQEIVSLVARQQIMTSTVEFHIFDVLAGNGQARAWRDRRADFEALEQKAAAMGCNARRSFSEICAGPTYCGSRRSVSKRVFE